MPTASAVRRSVVVDSQLEEATVRLSQKAALRLSTSDASSRKSGQYHALVTGLQSTQSAKNPSVKVEMATLLSGGRLRDLGPVLALVCAPGRPRLELLVATFVPGEVAAAAAEAAAAAAQEEEDRASSAASEAWAGPVWRGARGGPAPPQPAAEAAPLPSDAGDADAPSGVALPSWSEQWCAWDTGGGETAWTVRAFRLDGTLYMLERPQPLEFLEHVDGAASVLITSPSVVFCDSLLHLCGVKCRLRCEETSAEEPVDIFLPTADLRARLWRLFREDTREDRRVGNRREQRAVARRAVEQQAAAKAMVQRLKKTKRAQRPNPVVAELAEIIASSASSPAAGAAYTSGGAGAGAAGVPGEAAAAAAPAPAWFAGSRDSDLWASFVRVLELGVPPPTRVRGSPGDGGTKAGKARSAAAAAAPPPRVTEPSKSLEVAAEPEMLEQRAEVVTAILEGIPAEDLPSQAERARKEATLKIMLKETMQRLEGVKQEARAAESKAAAGALSFPAGWCVRGPCVCFCVLSRLTAEECLSVFARAGESQQADDAAPAESEKSAGSAAARCGFHSTAVVRRTVKFSSPRPARPGWSAS